jgi:protein-tyrosine kinase
MEHVSSFAQMIASTGPLNAAHAGAERVEWPQLKPYKPDWSALRDTRIVTGSRFEPANAAFDVLRTKVLRLLRENGWKSIAVTSPTAGCGKSVVASNLAFSLARVVDRRIALLDLDLRRPSLAEYLQILRPPSMEKFLGGTATLEDTFLSWNDSLAVGVNGSPVADPTGLLQNPSTHDAISKVQEVLRPDVTVYDMPPLFDNGDVLAFAPNIDCVLLIAGAGSSKMSEIEASERELARVTNVLGIVLNKCEYMPNKGAY